MLNVLGSFELQKLKLVSLSSNTVGRRITELFDNLLLHGVLKIQNSLFNSFAIQIDETTNVVSLTQFHVLVRYADNKHLEDELFCETLYTKTTSREIFDEVNRFSEAHGIGWIYVHRRCSSDA